MLSQSSVDSEVKLQHCCIFHVVQLTFTLHFVKSTKRKLIPCGRNGHWSIGQNITLSGFGFTSCIWVGSRSLANLETPVFRWTRDRSFGPHQSSNELLHHPKQTGLSDETLQGSVNILECPSLPKLNTDMDTSFLH